MILSLMITHSSKDSHKSSSPLLIYQCDDHHPNCANRYDDLHAHRADRHRDHHAQVFLIVSSSDPRAAADDFQLWRAQMDPKLPSCENLSSLQWWFWVRYQTSYGTETIGLHGQKSWNSWQADLQNGNFYTIWEAGILSHQLRRLKLNLQPLSPDSVLAHSLALFILLWNVIKIQQARYVLDLSWVELDLSEKLQKENKFLTKKGGTFKLEVAWKTRVMVRGGGDQAKFVYLDMPDFGLDVLLVVPIVSIVPIVTIVQIIPGYPWHWAWCPLGTTQIQQNCLLLSNFSIVCSKLNLFVLEAVQHEESGEFVQTIWAALSHE